MGSLDWAGEIFCGWAEYSSLWAVDFTHFKSKVKLIRMLNFFRFFLSLWDVFDALC